MDAMDSNDDFAKTMITRKPWENRFKAGKTALKNREFELAQRQLKSALRDASRFGKEDPRLGNIHASLAELYTHLENIDDAESHFKKVIEIWRAFDNAYIFKQCISLLVIKQLLLYRSTYHLRLNFVPTYDRRYWIIEWIQPNEGQNIGKISCSAR